MNVNACTNTKATKPQGDLKAFRLACITAHFQGKWRGCVHKKCRRLKRCVGGPRGGFKKFGKPICVVAGGEAFDFV